MEQELGVSPCHQELPKSNPVCVNALFVSTTDELRAMSTIDEVAVDHRWQWNPNLKTPHHPRQLLSVHHRIRIPLQDPDEVFRVLG